MESKYDYKKQQLEMKLENWEKQSAPQAFFKRYWQKFRQSQNKQLLKKYTLTNKTEGMFFTAPQKKTKKQLNVQMS